MNMGAHSSHEKSSDALELELPEISGHLRAAGPSTSLLLSW